MERKNDLDNPISIFKVLKNLKKYVWIIILCLIVSIMVIVTLHFKESDTSSKFKNYSVMLDIQNQVVAESNEEKYYQQELNKQLLFEGITKLFNASVYDEISKQIMNDTHKVLMPTEVPRYDGYTSGNASITFTVTSQSQKRAEEILQLYTSKLNEFVEERSDNASIEKIGKSVLIEDEEVVNSWVSVKNLLIIFVCIIIGFVIIGILIIFDDRIYTEQELDQSVLTRKFGKINAKGKLVFEGDLLKCYCEKTNKHNILILDCCEKESNLISSFSNIDQFNIIVKQVGDADYYQSIISADLICVDIKLGELRLSRLDEIMKKVESLSSQIDGCILDWSK